MTPGGEAVSRWHQRLLPIVVLGVAALPLRAGPDLQMRRLPTSPNALLTQVAMSRDGRYIAYPVFHYDSRGNGLAVRNIVNGREVEVVPDLGQYVPIFTFTPDSRHVIYLGEPCDTYEVSVLGGKPKKFIPVCPTWRPSFSPDGTQLAFPLGETVVITNTGGAWDRRRVILGVTMDPTWSPDGKKLARHRLHPGHGTADTDSIEVIDATTGRDRSEIGAPWRSIGALEWLPDGTGFLVIGQTEDVQRDQIWFQPYPTGERLRITNDGNEYASLSVMPDGKSFATVRTRLTRRVTVSDASGTREIETLPAHAFADALSVSVAANGSVVYAFTGDRGHDLAITSVNGAATRILTHTGNNWWPRITRDGSTIFFTAREPGDEARIYAVNADGTSPRLLRHSSGEGVPEVSADGLTIAFDRKDARGIRHVYVTDNHGEHLQQVSHGEGEELVRLSANGQTILYSARQNHSWALRSLQRSDGTESQLDSGENLYAIVSPDGRKVAYRHYLKEQGRDVAWLKVVPVTGGKPLLDTRVESATSIRFHPNGGVTFARKGNIFFQPLSGGAPSQLTHFNDEKALLVYDWTGDGKLVVSHLNISSDVVVVSNFRNAH